MRNKRNSFAILCTGVFAVSLILSGCTSGGKSSNTSGSGNHSSSQRQDGTFIVKFDTGYGSKVADQTVKSGEKAKKPADPTYDGYKFTGWFEDKYAVTEFDFETPITSDWTIYAGWKLDNEGNGGGEVTPPGEYTYTCTDLPDWITNDGCVIFAWAWSANDTGSWKSGTFGAGGASLSFDANEELLGFLLARCAAGTTLPDWNIHDDAPGRVYNQTEDITCTSGVYSYACASWKEYN